MALTKKAYFELLSGLTSYCEEKEAELPDEVTYDDLYTFIDNEIALLDKKAAAAAQKRIEKRAESDALMEQIYAALPGPDAAPISIDNIVTVLNDPAVTRNMVISRLGRLAKQCRIDKTTMTVDSHKVSVYNRI